MKLLTFASKHYQQPINQKNTTMAKAKTKSGKKNKPSAKSKKSKSAPAKKKSGKTPKPKKITKKKSAPEATTPVAPAESSPKIASAPTPKPFVGVEKKSEAVELEAIVVETPKEEIFSYSTPEQVAAPLVSAPVTPIADIKPDAIDLMVKHLNKVFTTYGKPVTKKGVEDVLNLSPKNAPYYVIPRYQQDKTFNIEITDGNKKAVTKSFPLAI